MSHNISIMTSVRVQNEKKDCLLAEVSGTLQVWGSHNLSQRSNTKINTLDETVQLTGPMNKYLKVDRKQLHDGMEALCTRVDKLQWEKNQLETKNVWLRESKPKGAAACESLKQSEKRISDLKTELSESLMQLVELQETVKQERSQAEKRSCIERKAE